MPTQFAFFWTNTRPGELKNIILQGRLLTLRKQLQNHQLQQCAKGKRVFLFNNLGFVLSAYKPKLPGEKNKWRSSWSYIIGLTNMVLHNICSWPCQQLFFLIQGRSELMVNTVRVLVVASIVSVNTPNRLVFFKQLPCTRFIRAPV